MAQPHNWIVYDYHIYHSDSVLYEMNEVLDEEINAITYIFDDKRANRSSWKAIKIVSIN